MGEINSEDFRKLQSDVTEIKIALLGNEFNENGLLVRMKHVEADNKANEGILTELVRWKCEAQTWKDQASKALRNYEQMKWKLAGIITTLSIIIPVFWNYIKSKIGF